MKIVLLNPPSPEKTTYVRVDRCQQKMEAWAHSLWNPISLCYCQSVLDESNFDTKLKDATAEKMSHDQTIDWLKKENPDVLILNTAVPTMNYDIIFAKEIKQINPNCKTIAIGMPPTILPNELIKSKVIDYCVNGEPELAVLDICESINKGSELKEKIHEHLVTDLDSLPFPALYDLNLDAYTVPFTRERLILVDPGRGCPFNCVFCLVPTYSKMKVRFRDTKKFVDELERDKYEYKINNFLFWNETPTFNEKHMISICDEIIKRKLNIKWMCPSRVDTVTPKMLSKMHEAGCWLMSLGIESASQKILNNVKKGITVDQIRKAIYLIKKTGILITAHFIVGLPGETKETAEKTIEFAKKIDVDYIQVYCAVPYPKTKLYEIAKKRKWIVCNDWSKYEIDTNVMRNDDLTSEEIREYRENFLKEFYFRPKWVLKEVLRAKSLKAILGRIVDGFDFIKSWVH